MADRRIDAEAMREIDERLRLYREHEEELRRVRKGFLVFSREKKAARLARRLDTEREDIGSRLVGALGDDPANDLSRHCDKVIDDVFGMAAGYLRPAVEDDGSQDKASLMAAVAESDSDSRKAWFARFLAMFSGLALEPGWRMSCFEAGVPRRERKTFFLTDDKGNFCDNVFKHLRFAGDASIAALDAVLLKNLLDELHQCWPDWCRRKWIVTGLRKFFGRYFSRPPDIDGRRLVFRFIEKGVDVEAISRYDYLPRVDFDADGGVAVRYVTFSESDGFSETVMKRAHDAPIDSFRREELKIGYAPNSPAFVKGW